jgi:hypothetical protein
MKENAKLSELTLEELQARKNKTKSAIIGLGIVMTIAVATLIYLAIRNKNYALIAVGMGSIISLLPSVIVLKQIEDEIKSRNL